MLSSEHVLAEIAAGRFKCRALDGRDFSRLAEFMPVSDWHTLGCKLKDGADAPKPREWSRENILAQLGDDLEFAIEKAENQRGISASCMFYVVLMWMWILEDATWSEDDYYDYGLPVLREIEEKYGADIAIAKATGERA